MAQCSEHHMKLNDRGEGKCSVPMWSAGCPAGFCDRPAYGKPVKYETFRDGEGRLRRMDGGYTGHVPYLACPGHGGPKRPDRTITPEQRKAASDALYAWQGACNGVGVTHSLLEAYRAFGPNTNDRNRAAPVKLMLLQLCHLAQIRTDTDLRELTEITTECEKMAGFKFDEDGKMFWIDGYKEVKVARKEEEGEPTRAVGNSGHIDAEGSPEEGRVYAANEVRHRTGETSPDPDGEVHSEGN